MTKLSRRRFLTISAACSVLPSLGIAAPTAHWRGVALGAEARLRLEGLTDQEAAPVFAAVEAELNRLENIFNLYRPASELSRLNKNGSLNAPAPELLSVLGLCSTLHHATEGAFDPSVQPLWSALAIGADEKAIHSARNSIGWEKVTVRTDIIRLPEPGFSALTLNGIAQGVITDRIAALLKSHSLRNVLIDMGEVVANGQRTDGERWCVGVAGPDGSVLKRITLQDRAIATSDAQNLMLTDRHGHILHPKGLALQNRLLSVSAQSAALADGLSTALCALPAARHQTALRQFPQARIEARL
ncbi:FAD:protein FMN transferase [Ruegeria sp.]|uniref:FAD:protein FMN transferase n=1 Tax=Ruegeria sp. TaxID=1879320 RepID=UPI003C7C0A60